MKARSLKPTKDKAMPKWRTEDRINRSTGQIYPDQIPGIDTGWNYNVGRSYIQGSAETYGEKVMRAAPEFRPGLLAYGDQFFRALKPAYKSWAIEVMDDEFSRGNVRPVGFLTNSVIDLIENDSDRVTHSTALVSIKDAEIRHAIRPGKKIRNKSVTEDDIETLISHVRRPKAILYDRKGDAIIYVFETPESIAKMVVDINDNDNGRIRNSMTTAGIVRLNDLKESRYELLEGEL